MGWTGLNRRKGMTDKEFFEAEFPSIEFLVNGRNGSTVYAAARSRTNGEVFGLVILTQTSRGYFNFNYKEMDETMGPYESRAPEKVLDALDELAPTDNESALEWRALSRAYHVARKARPKVSKGDVLRFPAGTWSNDVLNDAPLTVLDARRGYFAGEYGYRFRLNGWRNTNWVKEGVAA